MMKKIWEKYEQDTQFNLSALPKDLLKKGKIIHFAPKSTIVLRGDELKNIYFFKSGRAIGQRNYMDGKEYTYFSIDGNNGNVGLLELFARTEHIVATVVAVTEVTAIQLDAGMVYECIMNDIHLLRKCNVLLAQDLYTRSNNGGLFYYMDGLNRVRYYLAAEYGKAKKDVVILNSRFQDIANATGLSVRTVGRSIQKLKTNGEISDHFRKLIINEEQNHRMIDALCEIDFEDSEK